MGAGVSAASRPRWCRRPPPSESAAPLALQLLPKGATESKPADRREKRGGGQTAPQYKGADSRRSPPMSCQEVLGLVSLRSGPQERNLSKGGKQAGERPPRVLEGCEQHHRGPQCHHQIEQRW